MSPRVEKPPQRREHLLLERHPRPSESRVVARARRLRARVREHSLLDVLVVYAVSIGVARRRRRAFARGGETMMGITARARDGATRGRARARIRAEERSRHARERTREVVDRARECARASV
tara:strand:- start:7869 stop:8231 length:363 start_codon:yes stop_codon:yes gene_type:complete